MTVLKHKRAAGSLLYFYFERQTTISALVNTLKCKFSEEGPLDFWSLGQTLLLCFLTQESSAMAQAPGKPPPV